MSWRDLLTPVGETKILPWCGGGQLFEDNRTWYIKGKRPLEHGWYRFKVLGGREVSLESREEAPIPMDFGDKFSKGWFVKGYLVGDRMIPDGSGVDPNPDKLIEQTVPVFCVERGLEKFTRAIALCLPDDSGLIYLRQEFPDGPEQAALEAYQDRKTDLNDIPNVTPALDLAFRWVSLQRIRSEIRERELEALRLKRAAEEAEKARMEALMKDAGTALGRRALASRDFRTAAKEALKVGGAELLDVRESNRRGEMVVQYRFMERRLECVADAKTLQILDAGVCLTDHAGIKGDTWLTLESIPGVIAQAIRERKLVVFRGDRNHYEDDDWDRDDD